MVWPRPARRGRFYLWGFVRSCLDAGMGDVLAWIGAIGGLTGALGGAAGIWSARYARGIWKIERARRAEEIEDAERRQVDFCLVQATEYRWLLVNRGTGTAYGVHVDTGDFRVEQEAVRDFEEFPNGHEEPLFLARTGGVESTHIVVTWHHRPDRADQPQARKLVGP